MSSLKVLAERKTPGVNKTSKLFNVDPRLIVVIDGFNIRPIDMNHVASIESSYANMADIDALTVYVENNEIKLIDGHHRLTAIMNLINKGIDIISVPVKEFKGNNAERVALMITSQQGLKATPLQLGIGYRRLVQFGHTTKQISLIVGKSVQHVADMIKLAESDTEVQDMVKDGDVAAHIALAAVKEHGSEAGKVLKEKLTKVKAEGKTKVTAKTVTMNLVQAIRAEMAGQGLAEKLCPKHSDLIVFLRESGK